MARKAGFYAAMLNAEYEFEDGKIQTEAYLDPLGNWTGPGGITRHEDGRPVGRGDTWPLPVALALYARTFDAYAAEVDALLRRDNIELDQFQFDALVVFNWHMGIDTLDGSSMMTALRAKPPRIEEAAAAFMLYRRGTLWGGKTGPDGALARGPDMALCPAGPERDPMPAGVSWFKAMRGIGRRSAATGCLMLGYDWRKATAPDRFDMSKRTEWRAEENRWFDVVLDQTKWKDILAVARTSRLEPAPEPDRVLEAAKPKQVTIELPADFASWSKENRDTFWLNAGVARQLGAAVPEIPAEAPKPIIPDPAPAPVPKKAPAAEKLQKVPAVVVDGSKEAKFIEKSKRGKDANRAARGRETTVLGGLGTLGGGGTLVLANNVEKVGSVIEKLQPMTFLVMGVAFCAFLVVLGIIMWWNGRASLYHRRQHEQEPLG